MLMPKSPSPALLSSCVRCGSFASSAAPQACPSVVAERGGDLFRMGPERQLVAAEADALAGDARGVFGGQEHQQRRHVGGGAETGTAQPGRHGLA